MSGDPYPALGFDPAPGAVANVQTVADTLGTVAKDLGEAHIALTSISKSDSIWEGTASEVFNAFEWVAAGGQDA